MTLAAQDHLAHRPSHAHRYLSYKDCELLGRCSSARLSQRHYVALLGRALQDQCDLIWSVRDGRVSDCTRSPRFPLTVNLVRQ
jgi:hypothetical protein